ncbi:constitutive coactivator of peroxisome proliferator-activated receptor gamma-like, partial [Saccoglossus kowalevskii]
MRTYLACMECTVPMETVQEIQPQFKLFCNLLHYLIKNVDDDVICEWELNAFIAQAVTLSSFDIPALVNLKVEKVVRNAVHLATIFMKGVTTALAAVCACYKPMKMDDCTPWKYFDGKLFHSKYILAEKK